MLKRNSKKNSSKYSMTLFLLTFLFILGPRIGRSEFLDVISIISIILSIYFIFQKTDHWIPPEIVILSLILWIAIVYSGIITILNGSLDLFSFLRNGRALVNFAGGIGLVSIYRFRYGERFSWFILIDSFLAISLHGAIMVLQFLIPDFREHVYAITKPDNLKSVATWSYNFRMAGLTSGGGAGTSFLQSIGAILAVALWHQQPNYPTKTLLVVGFLLCFAGINLSGRTGLYMGLLGIVFQFFLYQFIKKKPFKKNKGLSNILINAFLIVSMTVIGLAFLNDDSNFLSAYQESIERLVNRNYRAFEQFLKTGRFQDSSITTLFGRMLFLPDDPVVLLFGCSNTGRGALDYISSDSGYVRLLFAAGIIGSGLIYIFYIYIITVSLSKRAVNPDMAFFSVTLSFMILAANIKEIFVLSRYFFSVSSLVVIALLYEASELRKQDSLTEFANHVPRSVTDAY